MPAPATAAVLPDAGVLHRRVLQPRHRGGRHLAVGSVQRSRAAIPRDRGRRGAHAALRHQRDPVPEALYSGRRARAQYVPTGDYRPSLFQARAHSGLRIAIARGRTPFRRPGAHSCDGPRGWARLHHRPGRTKRGPQPPAVPRAAVDPRGTAAAPSSGETVPGKLTRRKASAWAGSACARSNPPSKCFRRRRTSRSVPRRWPRCCRARRSPSLS